MTGSKPGRTRTCWTLNSRASSKVSKTEHIVLGLADLSHKKPRPSLGFRLLGFDLELPWQCVHSGRFLIVDQGKGFRFKLLVAWLIDQKFDAGVSQMSKNLRSEHPIHTIRFYRMFSLGTENLCPKWHRYME